MIECPENNRLEALKLLLKHKADYNLHGHFGNTPLLWASMKGHYDITAALVEHAKLEDRESSPCKNFLNHKNKDGINALFNAAKSNYRSIVNLLLDEGVDWSITNKTGISALHTACWGGYAEVASALLAKAHETANLEAFRKFLNGRNDQGKTALVDAAQRGQLEIVKELFEKYDADFLIPNIDECSALNLACWFGHTEVAMFLLRFASTKLSRERFMEFLNHRNKWGKTAFMDAAERGRLQMVEMLRQQRYGADYRIPNNNDVTPLQMSSWYGHKEVAAFILKTASDDLPPERFQTFINLRNKWGKTVLIDAADRNRPDIINLLLDHSALYSIRDNAGFTVLHYCAFRNHTPALRTLLERTSRDQTDDGGRFKRFLNQQSDTNRATALRDAASQKHMDSAMLLLDHGAAYDPVDSKKGTALHHVVERPDGNLALALLEYAGRDPDRGRFARFVNAKDEDGETVWAGARRRCMPRLVERLRRCGIVEGA